MNELRSILKEKDIHPKGYHKINHCLIIETNNGKYSLKCNTNNYDIYNYLNTRGFSYYPNSFSNQEDNYDLLEYVDDINIPENQRMEDLLILLSVLHHKTTYYVEIDLDDIKEIYENTKTELLSLLKYYHELNDYLDTVIFLSPSEYLLLRNISIYYFMLNYSITKLEEWYLLISKYKRLRHSLIHNNVSTEHILENDRKYLISWDKAKNSRPINDLISFYKKYYRNIKLFDMLNIYESNNVLEDEEKCLLFTTLAIPQRIEFGDNTLNDTIKINNETLYLKKVYEYIKNDFNKDKH